jgi:hypothetical protein
MVQGFNHNIKHKGKLYHIQTEDSGRDNPHIITHVFVGGNILASKKTSYADIVKADRLEQIVRELMEEQHKGVLRNLINGVYDDPAVARAESATIGKVEPPKAPSMQAPQPSPMPMQRPQVPVAQAAAPVKTEKSLDEIILSYLADREGE